MSNRLLSLILIVQTALLALLVGERIVPVAHADGPMTCEIANWPAVLTGQGFASIRVQVDEVRSTVPVEVRAVPNPVPVVMRGWQTSDRVQVSP